MIPVEVKSLVLDASVIGRWIWQPTEPASAALRAEFDAGRISVTVPALVFLELLNVAGRQVRWRGQVLSDFADRLRTMKFDVFDPELDRVAAWVDRGLTVYDASYVALAERLRLPLVTADDEILRLAPGVAAPL